MTDLPNTRLGRHGKNNPKYVNNHFLVNWPKGTPSSPTSVILMFLSQFIPLAFSVLLTNQIKIKGLGPESDASAQYVG